MRCILFHKWNGCVCKECGIKRSEIISYKEYQRLESSSQYHKWDGCVCVICGETRSSAPGIELKHDFDRCVCRKCGIKKQFNEQGHIWSEGKCSKCGIFDSKKSARSEHKICYYCKKPIISEEKWVSDKLSEIAYCPQCGRTAYCKKCQKEVPVAYHYYDYEDSIGSLCFYCKNSISE